MESLHVQDWLRRFSVEARGILGPSREVALDMPEEPLFMKADDELLQQAFVNLATNARDAMPAGGTLRIAVERCTAQSAHGALISPNRFLRIAVSDTGQGMSEETLKHLFEPLFTTKKGHGSGLGLAIVHQIVNAHGGYIFAESQPRSGSTFLVFLAIAEAPEPKLAPAAPIAIAAAAAKPRVVLVEDDEAVADGITGVLQAEGIECEVVTLGGAAAEAVERFHPSVVLLDVGLPDIDGREVFRRLRERWPDLPIIFSTGHAGMEAAHGERHHVAVLQKPYEADDLLRCIADITAMPIGVISPV
jgi:CheY-like chemotaxis protein